jgi:hypothetical protein
VVRYLNQGRADAGRPHIAPRNAAQILLTRPDDLTNGQRETAARLASACPEMQALASLIRSFAAMLDPDPDLRNEESYSSGSATLAPPTCLTCTLSPAALTSTSRPPTPR